MKISTYDIDGVIFINKDIKGITPGPYDFIITGRSYEEKPETERMLADRGIYNQVFYNPLSFDQKSRASSGQHKGNTIKKLIAEGHEIQFHVEDDEIQIAEIKKIVPELNIIHMKHNMTEKENIRNDYP
jgi:hypothetical protein